MESLSLLSNEKAIDSSIPNLMDLAAKSVPDFFSKLFVNPIGHFHCLSILFPVFQPLPSYQTRNRHKGAREGTAGLSSSGYTSGQSASRLKHFFASYAQFFLQSCKNGLGSAEIIHVILKGQLKNLI